MFAKENTMLPRIPGIERIIPLMFKKVWQSEAEAMLMPAKDGKLAMRTLVRDTSLYFAANKVE